MVSSSHDSRRTWILGGCIALAAVCLGWAVWSRLPPPQLKTDKQVFNTVDALFTAVTTHDRIRLNDCDQRLAAYLEAGRMSGAAAASLRVIIKQARDGQWEPAAKRLYQFIEGQRG